VIKDYLIVIILSSYEGQLKHKIIINTYHFLKDNFHKYTQRKYLGSLNIFVLSLKEFFRNKCQFHATALTLYTLLAIVPILALAFGIAQGFGAKEFLQEQIKAQIPQQEIILGQIFEFAQKMLEKTKGGLMVGFGLIILFWMAVSVLWQVEMVFNQIWHIKNSRRLNKRLSDYFSVMVILPLLLIASSSATIFLQSYLVRISDNIKLGYYINSAVILPLKIFPYFIVWILFSFLFIYMPNKKVTFLSGIISGIISGSIYQIVQFFYIKLQVGLSSYNAIYGSFAALPLFILWLRISWSIILYGAELAYVIQNYQPKIDGEISGEISFTQEVVIAIQVLKVLTNGLVGEQSPLSIKEISNQTNIQKMLIYDILDKLLEKKVVCKIQKEDDSTGYGLNLLPQKLTYDFVFTKLSSLKENKKISIDKELFESLPTLQKKNQGEDSILLKI